MHHHDLLAPAGAMLWLTRLVLALATIGVGGLAWWSLSSLDSLRSEYPPGEAQGFVRAEVISIIEEGEQEVAGVRNRFQRFTVALLDGPEQGQAHTITHGGQLHMIEQQQVTPGEVVVLAQSSPGGGQVEYAVVDKYRLDGLPYLVVAFVVLAVLIGGWKGLGSLAGLAVSLTVIAGFIVPHILLGRDPLMISVLGSLLILFITTYLAHGISRQTTVALVATFLALGLTAVLAILVVQVSQLSGLGSEDAYALQFGPWAGQINLQGLLLGGIIIGTLGALNDMTTTQSATIFELASLDPKLQFADLVRRGLSIGREHVASLINTLALAYAGSSMVLFILLIMNPSQRPLWVLVNSEMIYEEIVRTVAGSAGLMLAVPLVTVLAAWYVTATPLQRYLPGKEDHP